MSTAFLDYFRCLPGHIHFEGIPQGAGSGDPGYFRLGPNLICYGKVKDFQVGKQFSDLAGDALHGIALERGRIRLPFNPDQVANNLRYERYHTEDREDSLRLGASPIVRDLYYILRPLMPVQIRSVLQRAHLRGQIENPFPQWPVDRTVDRMFEKLMELELMSNGNDPIPFVWFWPEGKRAAFVLTHDVESSAGLAFCPRLMDMDSEYGFRASFQLVPEKRYEVSDAFVQEIKRRGFEVNVHDLNHDGNLFREPEEFRRRAAKINQYAAHFGARGFRSGALYRRLDWYDALNVSYDMSVPNVAHLDPQGGGCCTVMPYFVGNILELPVTMTQDYSLFHILKQYSIQLWKQQAERIITGNGLINLISHPDYLIAQEARSIYRQLLAYLVDTCRQENVWAALPGEVDRWWRLRHKLHIVRARNGWQIQGPGRERARLAYAQLANGKLRFTMAPAAHEELEPVYSVAAKSGESQAAVAELDLTTNVLEQEPVAAGRTREVREAARAHAEMAAGAEDGNGMAQAVYDIPETLDPGLPIAEQLGPEKRTSVSRPLRVCMVAYTFYESDNRVMRYAETLAQEGHDVEVFALQQGKDPKEEVIGGVRVNRLQGRVVNERNQLTYAWRIWLFLMRAFYQVTKNDLKERYDLVHVHSVPDFLVFSALVPRLRGTPVILDIHDILPEFYLGKFGGGKNSWVFRLLTAAEKMCANCASHVIIANHIWQERIISRSVSADRCTVVLNSPDRSIFHTSENAPAKGERFLLLYPGTLNWHQGLDIAIRAFAKISAQVPQADFHIYGEGPSKPYLARLIKECGLEGRVVLQDARRIREIAGVMEKADLGIVPKRKDNFGNEAFSTKIFEFMAMGVPVIVSDTRIDRYYFNDSLVRFFNGGDEEDLARCMLDLIQHPEKRRELVGNAGEYIGKNDWTAKKSEYLELVDRLTTREGHKHAVVGFRSKLKNGGIRPGSPYLEDRK